MTNFRKKLQDKLRKKYGWHSIRNSSSDWSAYYYKAEKGPWVHKQPELGRATIDVDWEIGGVLGDTHIMLTESFPESGTNEHDRSIGVTLSFDELEMLYLVAKEIHLNRMALEETKKK